jgi:hypothetical protein
MLGGTQQCSFDLDLGSQRWFDGLSRRVLLRSCSIQKAISFVSQKAEKGDAHALEMLQSVFRPIAMELPGYHERFVRKTDSRLVVSVIRLAKPWDVTKFLCHLCLSLGRYSTEVGLFSDGSLKCAFVKAGLLPDAVDLTRDQALSVLRRYILEDLRFHPISARKFGKYMKAAMDAINNMLFNNFAGDFQPLVTDIMLKEQATEILYSNEAIRKDNIVCALLEDPAVRGLLPENLSACSLTNPVHWTPQMLRIDDMTVEMVAEQNAALQCCMSAIDDFMDASSVGVKYPLLVGRAGSGKSHVLKLATVCRWSFCPSLVSVHESSVETTCIWFFH